MRFIHNVMLNHSHGYEYESFNDNSNRTHSSKHLIIDVEHRLLFFYNTQPGNNRKINIDCLVHYRDAKPWIFEYSHPITMTLIRSDLQDYSFILQLSLIQYDMLVPFSPNISDYPRFLHYVLRKQFWWSHRYTVYHSSNSPNPTKSWSL